MFHVGAAALLVFIFLRRSLRFLVDVSANTTASAISDAMKMPAGLSRRQWTEKSEFPPRRFVYLPLVDKRHLAKVS